MHISIPLLLALIKAIFDCLVPFYFIQVVIQRNQVDQLLLCYSLFQKSPTSKEIRHELVDN